MKCLHLILSAALGVVLSLGSLHAAVPADSVTAAGVQANFHAYENPLVEPAPVELPDEILALTHGGELFLLVKKPRPAFFSGPTDAHPAFFEPPSLNDTWENHYDAHLIASGLCYWLSEDPLGYQDGLNLYAAYMGVEGRDPTGSSTYGHNGDNYLPTWTAEYWYEAPFVALANIPHAVGNLSHATGKLGVDTSLAGLIIAHDSVDAASDYLEDKGLIDVGIWDGLEQAEGALGPLAPAAIGPRIGRRALLAARLTNPSGRAARMSGWVTGIARKSGSWFRDAGARFFMGETKAGNVLGLQHVVDPTVQKLVSTGAEVGSRAHRNARWATYQTNPDSAGWAVRRWLRQYRTNLRNAETGLAREKLYRDALGGESRILQTPLGNRQIDALIPGTNRLVQIKSGGMQYLTTKGRLANSLAIMRDSWLKSRGYDVEWILEGGGSKPLLKALDDAGIKYHLGSKL